MAVTKTVVEILNTSLAKIAEVKNLYPINKQGMILRYSKELSDYGFCMFRVSTKDPLLSTYGDILEPHRYHIRIKRGNTTVWQGAIVDNPTRNKNYIEVVGAEYLFYLDKKLIRRTTSDSTGEPAVYRLFESGTMASAVTAIVQEAIADYGSNHVLSDMTVGTIDNPNYPPGMTNGAGAALTGSWTFSTDIALQFDYHSILHVLQAFGIYTYADFEITNGLVFNFRSFLGNDHHYDVNFVYQTRGNIVDYNVPRLGKRMSNSLFGIAATTSGKVIHSDQTNTASVGTYGLLESATAYSDIKDQQFLDIRIRAELNHLDEPDESNVSVTLDEKGYPLGLYDIGDLVTVKIEDNVIDFEQVRRIVGITVNLHNTGKELTTVQTNVPEPNQYGALDESE